MSSKNWLLSVGSGWLEIGHDGLISETGWVSRPQPSTGGPAMPDQSLIPTLLLPELSLVSFKRGRDNRAIEVVASKDPKEEYCPHCATPSTSTYDHRKVRLKDEPFRTMRVWLTIIKRRLWCKPCGKPFTEPLPWARRASGTPNATDVPSCKRASATST